MDISVVLPIYNEVDNIRAVIEELETVLDPLGKDYEIVAVDDGSTDGTSKVLRDLAQGHKHLKVIFFRRNFGQSAAFDAGFRASTGANVVTMDADMQNDPHAIPAMLEKLDEGFDVVTGWRKNRQDGLFLRKVPSRIANWLIRHSTRTHTHDLGCSLKVYRREVTDELRLYGEMHRFISVLAEGVGAKIAEVEVNHRPRTAGTSKYGLKRTVKVMLDLTTVLFMRRFQSNPIYVFGGLGLVMLFFGFFIAAFVLWEKLEQGIWVHRNPLFMVAVVFVLVGVQLFGTGVVAEVIVRTYFESQRKTAYTIGSRSNFEG